MFKTGDDIMTSVKTKNSKALLITFAALFTAMIYVLTAFVHVPTAKGYIHIGDAIIFIVASLMPKPYAVFAASVGASLSDALSGYWIWVPATMLIKGLTVLAFTAKKPKMLCARNFIALVPALILCVGGYGLYSGLFIYGSLPAGFLDAPANVFQTVASAAVYIVLSLTFDKAELKKKLSF